MYFNAIAQKKSRCWVNLYTTTSCRDQWLEMKRAGPRSETGLGTRQRLPPIANPLWRGFDPLNLVHASGARVNCICGGPICMWPVPPLTVPFHSIHRARHHAGKYLTLRPFKSIHDFLGLLIASCISGNRLLGIYLPDSDDARSPAPTLTTGWHLSAVHCQCFAQT